ncbi:MULTISPECIES: DUF4118 domain-containing protein [unclassified Sphingomonas]|uniref:sensor histidine kinase n=1 Tax=unclassified Sphingomonas TaxID=196159 RepID=UPI00226AA1AD|nr:MULTISPECIES: DUF4118 domain-containing protein [unclassified Sphingomonas]
MSRVRLVQQLERLPLLIERQPLAYGLVLLVAGVAWAARMAFDPVLPSGFPYITFFPAVILSSFLFGRGPGVMAGVVCGLLSWYFFIPPRYSFALDRGTAIALAFYTFVISVDIVLIHWMQHATKRARAERERSRQLAEERGRLAEERGALADQTELLFNELQHRVSNNLQMVGAVLSLQKRGITDPAARQALDDASSKLQMIGRIQRQLYGTKGEQVPLDIFLSELTDDLIAAGGKPGITLSVAAAPGILLPPDAAIPVALIMAEAVANAIEHGFAERDHGSIAIELARHDDLIELCVCDDGHGLPESFDPMQATSLGLKVARTLARNLDARFEIKAAHPGTRMQLTLPARS